jgi:hypothetical protein
VRDGAPLNVWVLDRELGERAIAQIATSGEIDPHFGAHLVRSSDDLLTVQVASGSPDDDPDVVFYVQHHGTFELLRVERWPPFAPGCAWRVLLVMRAWPGR